MQVNVNELNTNKDTFKVEVDLSQSSDPLKQPFQVVYNGSTEFYNNHNKDKKLLPIYLYTQENLRNIVSNSNLKLIVYASTKELEFLTLGTKNGMVNKGNNQNSSTPGWSKLWSSNTNVYGVPSEVNVTYTYDSTANKITFYFPSIYTKSPPQQPRILSTYKEYSQIESTLELQGIFPAFEVELD
jgi:hypothetical protein